MPISSLSFLSPFFDPSLTHFQDVEGIAASPEKKRIKHPKPPSSGSTAASSSPLPIRKLSALDLLQQPQTVGINRGQALLPPHVELTDIEEDSAISIASGSLSRLPGKGQVCHMKGRAILFTKKTIPPQKIKEILLTPSLHPEIFSGVTDSRNLSIEETQSPPKLDIYNLQAAEDMQILTRIRAQQVPHGVVVLRDLMQKEERDFDLSQFYDRSEFRDDQVKLFTGQFQVLEINNGTVIIMDIDLIADDIPSVVSCETAADPGGFLSALTGGKDIKHQLETHTQNIFEFATEEN